MFIVNVKANAVSILKLYLTLKIFFMLLLVYLISFPCYAAQQINFSGTYHENERDIVREILKKRINMAKKTSRAQVKIKIALIDINGDGQDEILAYVQHNPVFCVRDGCQFMILRKNKNRKWMTILETMTSEDIKLSEHSTNSYRNVIFDNKYIWKWNGYEYEVSSDDGQLSFSDTRYTKERAIIKKILDDDIKSARLISSDPVAIGIAMIDINQDGTKEILTYIHRNSYFCGVEGCWFIIYIKDKAGNWSSILDITAQNNIRISNTRTDKFNDIIVGTKSILKWDGKKYIFDNRIKQ